MHGLILVNNLRILILMYRCHGEPVTKATVVLPVDNDRLD